MSSGPRRLIYFGTPAMAVPPLEALVAAGFDVAAVVTRVDKRRGRGSDVLPSPVKAAAVSLDLPVLHKVDDVIDVGADLGVVVAFGQLIRPHVLEVLPMVNLHFSLLPKWRGAAPVERALLQGDDVTGVCLMQLEEGLDTGPIHARVQTVIAADDTGDSLRRRLVDIGTQLLIEQLTNGLDQPAPQVGEPTYAAKLSTDDLRLDWNRSAADRDRVIRLGGAWTTFRDKRFKIVDAELVDPHQTGGQLADGLVGGLRLLTVQPEGKAPMSYRDFANGAHPLEGEPFV